MTKGRRRTREFLQDYKLDDRYLLAPDTKAGRAGILAGHSPDGNPVLVKIWPRKPNAKDADLEEIWRHELRQLHRLAGYPGAYETIARLGQSGLDSEGFYLVLDPGQRQPLEIIVAHASRNHWLKQFRVPANRARIWLNLKRLSFALEILHTQGLLHRNIDSWAVLSAGTEAPDFQLTGFEWSMRLPAAERGATTLGDENAEQYSFQHDWLLFGLLAASLLGVDSTRLLDLRVAPFQMADHLLAEEARLLRAIVHKDVFGTIDGDVIGRQIDEVVRVITAEMKKVDAKFYLALRLGAGTPLSGRIREVSKNEIETDDTNAQIAFIKDDLSGSPLLMALRPWKSSENPRLVLRGHHLIYQLTEYRHRRTQSTATWEFAYCDSIEANQPAPVNIMATVTLEPKSLEFMSIGAANERFPRLRAKLSSWENLRQQLFTAGKAISRESQVHRALTLTQFLDALYAAADVFPVEIVEGPTPVDLPDKDASVIRLRIRRDADREALSNALGLKPLSARLDSALLGDNFREEGWILTESRTLGERTGHDTEWQFHSMEPSLGSVRTYLFTGPQYTPILVDAFLMPAGSIGRDVQFRRRLKALQALKDHIELLKMLTDPRERILDSHDKLKMDDAYAELDLPKQAALRELTAILPLYLVQGPPGVGKTRLVRDLVQRRFADERTIRLLLSAQSNSAVDHLMSELAAILDNVGRAERPLVIRCRARESTGAAGPFELGELSRAMIAKFEVSPMASTASPKLQHRLRQLAVSAEQISPDPEPAVGPGKSSSNELRAFEGLVARAANVVFATTNSAELERLIDEKGQFDWTIIEEAGKATGSELISPLLLSHRRLLIGDHKQLPPFASDQIRKLLEVPESVRNVLVVGEEFIGRSLRDPTTEEILDELEEENSDDFPALCSEAIRVVTFFESIIEEEFKWQTKHPTGRSFAKQLTTQHRMHPTIAALVSRCFYDDKLKTAPNKEISFENGAPPFESIDTERLPPKPIVVVDMPYLQDTIGMTVGDELPRWHNKWEVSAVVEMLSLLRASNTCNQPPSIAVLSPYAQQVKRIGLALDAVWDSRLAHLSDFVFPVTSGQISGTVDAFQGNEADVVVVSLVRNNSHSNVRNALGFLSDFRRMNVLLSRARWQMILIGSIRFLEAVVAAAKGTDQEDEIEFLSRMVAWLRDCERQGTVAFVSMSKALGLTE